MAQILAKTAPCCCAAFSLLAVMVGIRQYWLCALFALVNGACGFTAMNAGVNAYGRISISNPRTASLLMGVSLNRCKLRRYVYCAQQWRTKSCMPSEQGSKKTSGDHSRDGFAFAHAVRCATKERGYAPKWVLHH